MNARPASTFSLLGWRLLPTLDDSDTLLFGGVSVDETKMCGKCKKNLPRAQFSPHRRMKSGLQTYCKKCARDWHHEHPDYVKKKNEEWRKNNPNYGRNWLRLRIQGITPEMVEELRNAQNNKCAGCGMVFENSKTNIEHVDHCHSSGVIRGLLCRNCNIILGLCKDKTETLINLFNYLGKHSH